MKIYINEADNDMLLVEDGVCALMSISMCNAEGYLIEGVASAPITETLNDNQNDDEGPTYAEQIASGHLREITMEELAKL